MRRLLSRFSGLHPRRVRRSLHDVRDGLCGGVCAEEASLVLPNLYLLCVFAGMHLWRVRCALHHLRDGLCGGVCVEEASLVLRNLYLCVSSQGCIPGEFDVLCTTYEMVSAEVSALKKHRWCFLVVDEAHRLKNETSKLSVVLRALHVNITNKNANTPMYIYINMYDMHVHIYIYMTQTQERNVKALGHAARAPCKYSK